MKSFSYRILLATLFAIVTPNVDASGAYLFSNATRRDRLCHPPGYTGVGGHIIITVGIRPDSAFRDEMEVSTRNVVKTWNRLEGRMPNIFSGTQTGIPSGHYDFESVLLHEVGHTLGLAHVNLASESGLPTSQQDFSRSTTGNNGTFDLNSGSDGVIGSKADVRGDDLPLLWFHKATNDPFANPDVVDITTYSIKLSDLPTGSNYVANGSETLSTRLGYQRSEATMQQGARSREYRRDLTPGCAAAMRLLMTGFDRLAGTSDDYTFELQFVGFTSDATITVGFDNSRTSFASATVGATMPVIDHAVSTGGRIQFNSTYKWFFNQTINADIPVPTVTFDSWAIF